MSLSKAKPKTQAMETYKIEMLRTYSTYFEIQASNIDEALKNFEKLGDFIYEEELDQNCLVNDELHVTDEQGNTYGVKQKPDIYKLVKK
jgi:hypothetical protein